MPTISNLNLIYPFVFLFLFLLVIICYAGIRLYRQKKNLETSKQLLETKNTTLKSECKNLRNQLTAYKTVTNKDLKKYYQNATHAWGNALQRQKIAASQLDEIILPSILPSWHHWKFYNRYAPQQATLTKESILLAPIHQEIEEGRRYAQNADYALRYLDNTQDRLLQKTETLMTTYVEIQTQIQRGEQDGLNLNNLGETVTIHFNLVHSLQNQLQNKTIIQDLDTIATTIEGLQKETQELENRLNLIFVRKNQIDPKFKQIRYKKSRLQPLVEAATENDFDLMSIWNYLLEQFQKVGEARSQLQFNEADTYIQIAQQFIALIEILQEGYEMRVYVLQESNSRLASDTFKSIPATFDQLLFDLNQKDLSSINFESEFNQIQSHYHHAKDEIEVYQKLQGDINQQIDQIENFLENDCGQLQANILHELQLGIQASDLSSDLETEVHDVQTLLENLHCLETRQQVLQLTGQWHRHRSRILVIKDHVDQLIQNRGQIDLILDELEDKHQLLVPTLFAISTDEYPLCPLSTNLSMLCQNIRAAQQNIDFIQVHAYSRKANYTIQLIELFLGAHEDIKYVGQETDSRLASQDFFAMPKRISTLLQEINTTDFIGANLSTILLNAQNEVQRAKQLVTFYKKAIVNLSNSIQQLWKQIENDKATIEDLASMQEEQAIIQFQLLAQQITDLDQLSTNCLLSLKEDVNFLSAAMAQLKEQITNKFIEINQIRHSINTKVSRSQEYKKKWNCLDSLIERLFFAAHVPRDAKLNLIGESNSLCELEEAFAGLVQREQDSTALLSDLIEQYKALEYRLDLIDRHIKRLEAKRAEFSLAQWSEILRFVEEGKKRARSASTCDQARLELDNILNFLANW